MTERFVLPRSSDFFDRPAFEPEALFVVGGDVAGRSPPPDHGVGLFRFEILPSLEPAEVVGAEVAEACEDRARKEGARHRADAFGELVHEKAALPGADEVHGVHPDSGEDELRSQEADSVGRKRGRGVDRGRAFDVEENLGRGYSRRGLGLSPERRRDRSVCGKKLGRAGPERMCGGFLRGFFARLKDDAARRVDQDSLPFREDFRCVAGADDAGYSQFTGENGRVTGPPAFIGDDGPHFAECGDHVGGRHPGDEDVAVGDLRDFGGSGNEDHPSDGGSRRGSKTSAEELLFGGFFFRGALLVLCHGLRSFPK